MFIVCISASNIKHARENSTSLKSCMLIEKMINTKTNNSINVEIIPLIDYGEFLLAKGTKR